MPDIASTTIANRQPIICSLSCRASRTFRFLKIALRGRPELKACHAFLDAGDMVAELRERGIGFTSLHENLDTTTPGGRLGGRPPSPPRKSSGPPATSCPTPVAPSPRSPSSSASPPAPSTTTSPTCANCGPVPYLGSSKPPRSSPSPTRSISAALSVPQLQLPPTISASQPPPAGQRPSAGTFWRCPHPSSPTLSATTRSPPPSSPHRPAPPGVDTPPTATFGHHPAGHHSELTTVEHESPHVRAPCSSRGGPASGRPGSPAQRPGRGAAGRT